MIKRELRCQRQPWRDGVDVAVLEYRFGDGPTTTWLGAPPVMGAIHEGEAIFEPTLTLTVQQAQQLMDELWSCGLRPTQGSGSAGSLAATERHLKDLQDILRKSGVL